MLTDEPCMEFRRMPGSFNDMVRAIHASGAQAERERCVKIMDDLCECHRYVDIAAANRKEAGE